MPRVTRSNSIQEVKEEVVVSDEEVVDSKNDISPAQKAVSSNKAKTLSQYVMIAPGISKLIKFKFNFLYHNISTLQKTCARRSSGLSNFATPKQMQGASTLSQRVTNLSTKLTSLKKPKGLKFIPSSISIYQPNFV